MKEELVCKFLSLQLVLINTKAVMTDPFSRPMFN